MAFLGSSAAYVQEGLLINDSIDAIGFTQNNFKPAHTVNLRFTGVVGSNADQSQHAVHGCAAAKRGGALVAAVRRVH